MKKQSNPWKGLLLLCVGFLLTTGAQRIPMNPYVAAYLAIAGLAFLGFGLINIVFSFHLHQALIKHYRQRAKAANRGVVWVWVVALAGICLYALAFYVMVYPTLQVIGIVEDMTTWDANAAFTLNLVKTVLNWHPILFIVGLLIWAFVNSQRREDVTYPAY